MRKSLAPPLAPPPSAFRAPLSPDRAASAQPVRGPARAASRVRPGVVVLGVLPALMLAAACSGGGSGGSAAPDGGSGASPSAVSTLAGHAPLTVQQLTQALVTDSDVPGWVVQQTSDDNGVQTTAPEAFNPDDLMAQGDGGGQSVLHADTPRCQPLADVVGSKPAVHRMASVGATFAQESKGGGPKVVDQMLIASHAPGDAQRVMDAVRAALGSCASFQATDGEGRRTPFAVAPGPAVRVGDASVTYTMTDSSDKKTGTALVTVVRTGDTITSYVSTKAAGGAGPVPLAVARKQSAKLTALLGRSR